MIEENSDIYKQLQDLGFSKDAIEGLSVIMVPMFQKYITALSFSNIKPSEFYWIDKIGNEKGYAMDQKSEILKMALVKRVGKSIKELGNDFLNDFVENIRKSKDMFAKLLEKSKALAEEHGTELEKELEAYTETYLKMKEEELLNLVESK